MQRKANTAVANQKYQRWWTISIVTIVLVSALGLGFFVSHAVAQIRQALAEEVLEQQNDVAALLRDYAGLMLALEQQRLAPSSEYQQAVISALQAARTRLRTMRQQYSFARLDGAANAHAFVQPVLADITHWLRAGVPGYTAEQPEVISISAQRVIERYPKLLMIAKQTNATATALLTEQTHYLSRFRDTLVTLLSGFTLLALLIAVLLIRQRNLQMRLALERERHAQAARFSEQRFKDFADTAADWFWETDVEGRITYLSDGYQSVIEDPVAQIVGVNYQELPEQVLTPSDTWQSYLALLRARQAYQNIEFEWQRSDGDLRVMDLSGRPVQGLHDEFLGYRGVGRDITDRYRMEHALFEEKERLRVTLASIGDAVITSTADGHVEYLNPVAETLTGWSLAEAKGQALETVFRIVNEDTGEPMADPVARCLSEDRIIGLTNTVLISRSGREYAIQETSAPIRDRDKQTLGVVLVFSDVTEARQLERKITHQAAHDALTGLVNRREFERRLQRVLSNARVDHTEHALCYLDLDQFKMINDTCGHSAGDELLRQVAALFLDQVRNRDTLARVGGDEFAVLLEHCSSEQAKRVANKLRQTIEQFRFGWDGKSFALGVSIGLVPLNANSESIGAVLRAADNACYVAKDAGRNRIHVYHENDFELARRHGEMQWVSNLQQALIEDRFLIYAQPITPIKPQPSAQINQQTSYIELLLRMQCDDGRIVLPGAFLPAAERYHMAARIDRWMINAAFQWLANHPEQLQQLKLCSINLSGQSLSDGTFGAYVIEQFEELAIPAHKICFEVTETAAITNLMAATQFMSTIKKRGCYFALDDFGSGLSSFGYLKNLPVDFVKIDGLFVKDVADDPIDFAMVRAINEIGQLMGKQTVAECVEDLQVFDKLREIGVNYAQGYALGKPQPITHLIQGMPTAHTMLT